MSNTDTVEIPDSDTAEGKLWCEILAHDNTTAAAVPAGNDGMLIGGNVLSPPALVAKVNQADTDEGVEHRTNTNAGMNAFFRSSGPRLKAVRCALTRSENT